MRLPFFIKDIQPHSDIKKQQLSRQYTYLRERLDDIRANFDFATDADDIDEENAVLAKLAALYKQARAEGTVLEYYEQKK